MINNLISDKEINILIVDDKPNNWLIIEGCLSTMKCNILLARSGNEALDLIWKNDLAVILLNTKISDIDGFQIAKRMRESESSKSIPIIFLTNCCIEQWSVFNGYELGAVDYLLEPIDPVLLRSKICVFLDLYKQRMLLKIQAELLESKVNELLALKEVNFHLENLSSLDGLTGIPNRRNFDHFIKMSWKNALREQQPLSLIMADIDYFKAYNDNYGHLQGDECLIHVANTLVASVKRPNDLVARYGGEEFIAVLSNTDREGAGLVAERMRKSVEMLDMKHDRSSIADCVTISLGVTTIIPQTSDSIADFINSVDDALYQAKLDGRNRVYADSLSGLWHTKPCLTKGIHGQRLGAK